MLNPFIVRVFKTHPSTPTRKFYSHLQNWLLCHMSEYESEFDFEVPGGPWWNTGLSRFQLHCVKRANRAHEGKLNRGSQGGGRWVGVAPECQFMEHLTENSHKGNKMRGRMWRYPQWEMIGEAVSAC